MSNEPHDSESSSPTLSTVWRFADEDTEVVIEPSPRRIRVQFGGEVVADSRNARLLHERGKLPVYFFPREDVREETLVEHSDTGRDPKKGPVRFQSVRAGGRTAERAARSYPETPAGCPDLSGFVAFRWNAMDAWYEEDEQVYVHPRDPYTRIDALESSRHVEVLVGDVTVADSRRPVLLFETGLPVRYYLPKVDVDLARLAPTETRTACPYKGATSQYWRVEAGGEIVEDAAWCYENPKAEAVRVAGRIAFFNERVTIRVDGEELDRPETPWS